MSPNDGSLLGALARRLAYRLDKRAVSSAPDTGGAAEFATFVDEEVAFEVARRERAETRGAALITSSAALTTLAFAGAAFVTAEDGFHPPRATLWALLPTTVCFLLAGYFGLRAGRVMNVNRLSITKIRAWDKKKPTMWQATGADALWTLTGAKIGMLESLRGGTNTKMVAAARGGYAQVAGLFFLTLAVSAVLAHAAWPDQRWWLDMLQPLGP